ncbi:helix-turn-helix domain-containing protein [Actinomadura adrarensis]|uniref:Helix-turn-helix domain-containing protein n=1 Tax=Actinomadura adrarensis TaxID=1819600 RepID=A0ABW3CSJ0_9ACTN
MAAVPTVRQRRLGAELRRLREAQGLTAEEIASRLAWSTSKISRIENARIGARVSDVRLLLELYKVEEHHMGEILALAQAATERGWWAQYQDSLTKEFAAFVALEDEASRAFNYGTYTVPGLLQCEPYARSIIRSNSAVVPNMTPRDVDRRVHVRKKRQEVLHREQALHFATVIDESVLMRLIDSRATMRAQLAFLIEVSELPNVDIRVISLDAPREPVFSESFTLLEFSPAYDVQFPDLLYIDNVQAVEFVDDKITYPFRRSWEQFRESAMSPEDSIERIARAVRDY